MAEITHEDISSLGPVDINSSRSVSNSWAAGHQHCRTSGRLIVGPGSMVAQAKETLQQQGLMVEKRYNDIDIDISQPSSQEYPKPQFWDSTDRYPIGTSNYYEMRTTEDWRRSPIAAQLEHLHNLQISQLKIKNATLEVDFSAKQVELARAEEKIRQLEEQLRKTVDDNEDLREESQSIKFHFDRFRWYENFYILSCKFVPTYILHRIREGIEAKHTTKAVVSKS